MRDTKTSVFKYMISSFEKKNLYLVETLTIMIFFKLVFSYCDLTLQTFLTLESSIFNLAPIFIFSFFPDFIILNYYKVFVIGKFCGKKRAPLNLKRLE